MLADTRIISRHKDYQVLGERQAVVFRDSTVLYLHQVQRDFNGKHQSRHVLPDTYLRALFYDKAHWCVFDLRTIHPSFALDFSALLARDHPGVVLYTLRQHFAGDAEFIDRAFRHFQHIWTEPATDVEPLIIAGDYPADRLMFQPELRRAA